MKWSSKAMLVFWDTLGTHRFISPSLYVINHSTEQLKK
jgi:hypothetical protein